MQPRRTSARRSDGGVGQVAVVRDRQAAELEIGIQRLHVAQHGVAGGGVAVVPESPEVPGQRCDHPRVAKIVADQPQALVADENGARRG